LRYGFGSLALVILAFVLGGGWLWLLWPAVSLGLVKASYLVLGASGFQKRADGQLSPAARWLFAPYLAAAWLNSRLWTRKHPQPDQVVDNVWLGRIPTGSELGSFKAIVDLCAELPLDPQGRAYYSVPVLDLTAPTTAQCLDAAQAIERLHQHGPLLVCCALGYSRSATAVAAWLLTSGRAATVDEAVAMIRTARAQVVLHPAHREALEGLPHAR
jgi:protein-tyrosine phosphatase